MKLRVWHIINPPNRPMRHPVETPEEAAEMIDRLANRDLRHNWIQANAFGLEYYDEEAGEWYEWHSEDDDKDIIDIVDGR